MYLIREIMYCKPGKVRALVEKFTAMNKLSERVGMPKMRIMTDFCAERYWTIVSEMEVTDLNAFEQMMSNPAGSAEDMKEFENIMKGYHDLVDHGKREIYKIEVYLITPRTRSQFARSFDHSASAGSEFASPTPCGPRSNTWSSAGTPARRSAR